MVVGGRTYGFVPRVRPSIGSRVYLTAFVFLKGDRWGEVTEARRIWLTYPIRKPMTPGAVRNYPSVEINCEFKTSKVVPHFRAELLGRFRPLTGSDKCVLGCGAEESLKRHECGTRGWIQSPTDSPSRGGSPCFKSDHQLAEWLDGRGDCIAPIGPLFSRG